MCPCCRPQELSGICEETCQTVENQLSQMHCALKAAEEEDDTEGSKATLGKYESKRGAALEAAMKAGDIDPRSYLGVLFRQQKKDDTEYLKASRARQQEIRKEWLKEEMNTFRVKHVHQKSFRRVDWTKGEYLNLGQLVQAEGGWSINGASIVNQW